jgi:hypothetical protein
MADPQTALGTASDKPLWCKYRSGAHDAGADVVDRMDATG